MPWVRGGRSSTETPAQTGETASAIARELAGLVEVKAHRAGLEDFNVEGIDVSEHVPHNHLVHASQCYTHANDCQVQNDRG